MNSRNITHIFIIMNIMNIMIIMINTNNIKLRHIGWDLLK